MLKLENPSILDSVHRLMSEKCTPMTPASSQSTQEICSPLTITKEVTRECQSTSEQAMNDPMHMKVDAMRSNDVANVESKDTSCAEAQSSVHEAEKPADALKPFDDVGNKVEEAQRIAMQDHGEGTTRRLSDDESSATSASPEATSAPKGTKSAISQKTTGSRGEDVEYTVTGTLRYASRRMIDRRVCCREREIGAATRQ